MCVMHIQTSYNLFTPTNPNSPLSLGTPTSWLIVQPFLIIMTPPFCAIFMVFPTNPRSYNSARGRAESARRCTSKRLARLLKENANKNKILIICMALLSVPVSDCQFCLFFRSLFIEKHRAEFSVTLFVIKKRHQCAFARHLTEMPCQYVRIAVFHLSK